MVDLIQRLTDEFGEPTAAQAPGHDVYQWTAKTDEARLIVYVTVYRHAGQPASYITVVCQANGNGGEMMTAEVQSEEDIDLVFGAISECIGPAHSE
jgi:hypothetical protein